MIREMAVFEAWQKRNELKVFVSLSPLQPCRIELLAEATSLDASLFEIYANGKKADRSSFGWESIYARPLNFFEKLWRKLK